LLIEGDNVGGGKSALGCLWCIEMALKYPGSRGLVGRSKLKTLKDTTLNTFFEVSSKLGIGHMFDFNAQSNIIKFNNGSQIILKDLFLYPSDPNFDSLGSLELTYAFIDECNQITFKAWQVVKSRIRYKLNEFKLIPKILGTCNPAKNWTYQYFFKAKKNKSIEDYRKFVQSLPTDNPNLPESYIQSLLQLDKISKERLYFGNWEYDNDPSCLIDFDSALDYFKNDHVIPGQKKYITADIARKGRDKTIIRVWAGLVSIERHEMKVSKVTESANLIKMLSIKHQVPMSRTIADEDGVGGGVVDILGCVGFVNNSRPLFGENYNNLKSQCSFGMSKLITDKKIREICKSPEVMQAVSEEMEQVKQANIDDDGKVSIIPKDTVKEHLGRSPDEWDSIMMRYYFELVKSETVFL
jgi:hypothetical protein